MVDAQPLHRRALVGHPVDVATGTVFTAWEDFAIPGPYPLVWRRFFNTSYLQDGPFGKGWVTPFSVKLRLTDNRLVFLNDDAAEVVLEVPKDGERINHPGIQYETIRKGNRYIIWYWHHDQRFIFERIQGRDEFRLVRVENLVGQGIDLLYTGNRWTGLKDSGGRKYQIHYDAQGRIQSIMFIPESAKERPIVLVKYEYDRAGRLTAVYDRTTYPMRYAYDEHDRLIKETNRLGGSFHFEYDEQGRCVHTWGDGGFMERRLAYDADARITTVTDSRGAMTTYSLGPLGLVTMITTPAQAKSITLYDDLGRKTQEISPINAVTSYSYDASGNLTRIAHPNGLEIAYEYNASHQKLTETDSAGAQTRWTYDYKWRVISKQNPMGDTTRYEYNDQGLVQRIEFPQGRVFHVVHAPAQRRVSITEGDTTWIQEFDVLGNQIAERGPLGFLRRFRYNPASLLVGIEEADGTIFRMEYNVHGDLTAIFDAYGAPTRYEYDRHGNLERFTDQSEMSVHFEYDTEDRLAKIVNEKGEEYHRFFNAEGNVIAQHYFDGRIETYEFDPAGRTTTIHLPDGRWIKNSFNSMGQITERSYSAGDKETFEYNLAGLLVSAVNQHAICEFEYDTAGRVVLEVQNGHRIAYKYDHDDNLIALYDSDFKRQIDITYDSFGRPHTISDGSEVFQRNTYDELNRLIKRLLPGGVGERFEYDSRSRPLMHEVIDSSGQRLVHRAHKFDNNGSITAIRNELAGGITYEYDNSGHLIKETRASGESVTYAYDACGNLVERNSKTLEYRQGHTLTKIHGSEITHDLCGNPVLVSTGKESTSWMYNENGELTRVVHADQSVTEYGYDAFGRRVFKEHGGSRTEFVWSFDSLLGEKTPDQGQSAWYLSAGFIPLAIWINGERKSAVTSYQGAPVKLLNEDGTAYWYGEYDSFGVLVGESTSGWSNPLRFAGQYSDRETGLSYCRFRYYNPTTGRYQTPDPTGILGGVNPYLYAPNPINWIDPLGLNCGRQSGCPQVNRARGKAGEQAVKQRLVSQGYAVLGEQVAVRTPQGTRVVDLVMRNPQGQIIHVEVKTGNAARSTSQCVKDALVEQGQGTYSGSQNLAGNLRGAQASAPTVVEYYP